MKEILLGNEQADSLKSIVGGVVGATASGDLAPDIETVGAAPALIKGRDSTQIDWGSTQIEKVGRDGAPVVAFEPLVDTAGTVAEHAKGRRQPDTLDNDCTWYSKGCSGAPEGTGPDLSPLAFEPDVEGVGEMADVTRGLKEGRHVDSGYSWYNHHLSRDGIGPNLPPLADFRPDTQEVGDVSAVTRGVAVPAVREDESTYFRNSVSPPPHSFIGLEPLPPSAQ